MAKASFENVYPRGNIYWIRYTDSSGKQQFESSKSRKLKDAQDLLRLRMAAVVKQEEEPTVKIKNSTFFDLVEEYLSYCVNQSNYRNTENMMNGLKIEFGNLPLKNFTTLLLEKYQSKLLSTPRPPLKGTVEPRPPVCTATVDRRIAEIKSMFTKAVDWKMCSKSVSEDVHKVKIFKKNLNKTRFLSREEITDLLKACDSNVYTMKGVKIEQKQPHLKPFIIFGLTTGCRKDEILSLKWSEVDLKHGFLYILKSKNGEGRQIKINKTLHQTLESLSRRDNVPYVFHVWDEKKKTGKRFDDVKRSFGTACKKAGIRGATPHTLRHTFASHLVMSGTDITTVSRMLGHKSLTMTLRYAHLAPSHFDKAANALNDVIGIIESEETNTSTNTEIITNTKLIQSEEKGLRLIA